MINDYRLLKKLGEGSTAQVWEAYQETTNTKCALKIFATHKNPDLKELVRNEVNMAAKVQHKHMMKMQSAEEEAIL